MFLINVRTTFFSSLTVTETQTVSFLSFMIRIVTLLVEIILDNSVVLYFISITIIHSLNGSIMMNVRNNIKT